MRTGKDWLCGIYGLQFHFQVSVFSLFLYFFVCILNIKYSSCEEGKRGNFVFAFQALEL